MAPIAMRRSSCRCSASVPPTRRRRTRSSRSGCSCRNRLRRCVRRTQTLLLLAPGEVDQAPYPIRALVSHLAEGEHGVLVFPGIGAGLLAGLGAGPRAAGVGQLQLARLDGVAARNFHRVALGDVELPLVIEAQGIGSLLGGVCAGGEIGRESLRDSEGRADRERADAAI